MCEVLVTLLWCLASVLPWCLFLFGQSFHHYKMNPTNIFEVPVMPEAEVPEEEEEEEAPEEAVPVAEPEAPEAAPAEGIRWCPGSACPALWADAVLTALWPSAFCGEGCEVHLGTMCLYVPVRHVSVCGPVAEGGAGLGQAPSRKPLLRLFAASSPPEGRVDG